MGTSPLNFELYIYTKKQKKGNATKHRITNTKHVHKHNTENHNNPKETGVKILNTNGERFRESKIGIFYHVEDGD